VLDSSVYLLDLLDESGRITREEVPMRNALNEVLRDWYVADCQAGVDRWNKRVLEAHGVPDRIYLPSRKFNRRIGVYAGRHFDPWGNPLSEAEWQRRRYEWLPIAADKEYLRSIQAAPVYKPGQFANYIAPPQRGINRLPLDFEYVRTEA
jgi:benzoyl-CoA 2,3-dioxygenase component B